MSQNRSDDVRLTPQMRMCLDHVAQHRRPLWPKDLPGGVRTVRALQARGLVTLDGARVVLTLDGEQALR